MVPLRRPESYAATRHTHFNSWLLCLLLPFSGWVSLRAQDSTTGALTGRVPPLATVTLQSAETGERTSILADRDGRFLLTQLTPGPYTFTTVLFGQPRPVTILLGETTVLRQLPAVAPSDLPHANPDADADGLLSFQGLAPSENATLLDGVSADQSFSGVPRGTAPAALDLDDDAAQAAGLGRGRPHGAPYSFSQAAVRATHVSGQGEILYTALTGNAAGGIVATVSRSGSTKLHGGVFTKRNQARSPHPIRSPSQRALQTASSIPARSSRTTCARSRAARSADLFRACHSSFFSTHSTASFATSRPSRRPSTPISTA